MTAITPALLNGRDLLAEATSEVRSPYDGSPVGAVPACTTEDIDAAVAVALERHRRGAPPAHERAAVLDRAAALLRERSEEFAASISSESAKPITTAEVEVERAIDTLRFSAAVARTLTGEMIPVEASAAGVGKLGFALRVPIGVVGAISPFNFPLNLVCHKIAPAVAAGCPVVLKPASATPLTALRIARLFEEAGLLPGWLNVITCSGQVADRLVGHPDVAMITFTGSPKVGWDIRARAPRKRVGLELGNNAPLIVEPGVEIASLAPRIAAGGYSFAGQSCISVQRVYAHREIHDELVEALAEAADATVVGAPSEPATQVSALISPAETERVVRWIDEAVTEGAEVAAGAKQVEHGVLRPTVLTGVTPQMAVSHNEVFGPVIGVSAYDDIDDAIAAANDTRYGLQAGVFTPDIEVALDAVRRLDFGGVLINEVPTWRADQQPYGGLRDSGNTREGPAYAAQEMTELRMVTLQG